MELLSRNTRDKLIDQVAELRVDVKALKRERETIGEELGLSEKIRRLNEQIAKLEVGKSKIEEQHARELREVEHQVGLQRKRQEFEVKSAKRETELTVREENLHAEQERFDRDMNFQREELSKQVQYLKELIEKTFERLPSASMTLRGNLVSAGGNGDHNE